MTPIESAESHATTPFASGSNALLAAIVQSAGDAIIGLDLNGTVLSWNRAASRLFGHDAATMIGAPIDRITPYEQQDVQNRMLGRIRAGRAMGGISTTYLDATGRPILVNMTASPVRDAEGSVVAASIVARERPSASAQRQSAWHQAFAAPLTERNILVVEDEPLVGLGLAAMLENAGFDVIGPAKDLATALALLERHDCALALLDVNLGQGETSAPLAQRLTDEGVPFFVMSGYPPESQPAVFGRARSFPKPIRAHALVAAVQEVLG